MSDKPNDGGPAFAALSTSPMGDVHHQPGMSLRDWFAGQALAGMIAPLIAADPAAIKRAADTDGFVGKFPAYVALRAYQQADAMLAERSKAEPR